MYLVYYLKIFFLNGWMLTLIYLFTSFHNVIGVRVVLPMHLNQISNLNILCFYMKQSLRNARESNK